MLGARGGTAWLVALACALALPAIALGGEPAQLPVKPFTLSADPHA